jgi:hypothetical protein
MKPRHSEALAYSSLLIMLVAPIYMTMWRQLGGAAPIAPKVCCVAAAAAARRAKRQLGSVPYDVAPWRCCVACGAAAACGGRGGGGHIRLRDERAVVAKKLQEDSAGKPRLRLSIIYYRTYFWNPGFWHCRLSGCVSGCKECESTKSHAVKAVRLYEK